MFTKEIFELLTELFRFFRNIFSLRKAGDALVAMAEIYDNLKNVLQSTDANRIVVMRAENNGGIIKPGCNVFTSIIYEDFSDNLQGIKSDFQRTTLDSQFNSKLVYVYQNQEKKICVDDLQEGLFKTMFGAEGMRYAEMFYIHHDKKAFYFAVAGTYNACPAFDTPQQRKAITVAINNIRNIFRSHI